MEPELIKTLLTSAAGTGLGSLVLVVALIYLHKNNQNTLAALQVERDQRIKSLEQSREDCQADRKVLHGELEKLQAKVEDIYTKWIDHLRQANELLNATKKP